MQTLTPRIQSHRTTILAIVIVLTGLAVVLYPKLTDLRYALAQAREPMWEHLPSNGRIMRPYALSL